MALYLDTLGNTSVAIGICDRCKKKVPIGELRSDGNSPGLRVCQDAGCYDHFDPYRLPARKTEKITIKYPRPDVDLSVE